MLNSQLQQRVGTLLVSTSGDLKALPHRSSRVSFEDPLTLVPRILTKLYSLWVAATYPFASLGRKVSFHFTCNLQNTGLMKIGNSVTIAKDVWLHVVLSAENKGEPALIIGDRCTIARRTHISARNHIQIEDDVVSAASVLIEDQRYDYDNVTLPIRKQDVVH